MSESMEPERKAGEFMGLYILVHDESFVFGHGIKAQPSRYQSEKPNSVEHGREWALIIVTLYNNTFLNCHNY